MSDRQSMVLLGVGALAGLLLALGGIVDVGPASALPADAAARINDRLIGKQELESALQRYAADSRNVAGQRDADWVLNRLIEEELLIQRGVAIGLVDSSPPVRNALVQATIESIVAPSQADAADRAVVRDWYSANISLFAGEPTYRVRAYRYATEEAASTDTALSEQSRDTNVPDRPIPLSHLRNYLGGSSVALLSRMGAGEISVPYAANGSWYRVAVAERIPGGVADFEADYAVIENEWRRRQGERVLREELRRLREAAEITVTEPAP